MMVGWILTWYGNMAMYPYHPGRPPLPCYSRSSISKHIRAGEWNVQITAWPCCWLSNTNVSSRHRTGFGLYVFWKWGNSRFSHCHKMTHHYMVLMEWYHSCTCTDITAVSLLSLLSHICNWTILYWSIGCLYGGQACGHSGWYDNLCCTLRLL